MRVSEAKNCSSHNNCERLHWKVPGFVLDLMVLLAKKLPAFIKDTRYFTGLKTILYDTEIFKDGAFDCEVVSSCVGQRVGTTTFFKELWHISSRRCCSPQQNECSSPYFPI